jgi:hypothetical protein
VVDAALEGPFLHAFQSRKVLVPVANGVRPGCPVLW